MVNRVWKLFRDVADTMELSKKFEMPSSKQSNLARTLNMLLAASSLFAASTLAISALAALVVLALALALIWAILVGILGIKIELNPAGIFV